MENEELKENIKKNSYRGNIVIIAELIVTVLAIIAVIAEKEFIMVLIALQSITIVMIELYNRIIQKDIVKKWNLSEELCKSQNRLIEALMKNIAKKEEIKIMKLEDIKIPSNFCKPGKKKMNERMQYFEEFEKYQVPVIVNEDRVLIDGYTSYLVAKRVGNNCIEVIVEKE